MKKIIAGIFMFIFCFVSFVSPAFAEETKSSDKDSKNANNAEGWQYSE